MLYFLRLQEHGLIRKAAKDDWIMSWLFSHALEHLLMIKKKKKEKKICWLWLVGSKYRLFFVSLVMYLWRITHASCLTSRKIFAPRWWHRRSIELKYFFLFFLFFSSASGALWMVQRSTVQIFLKWKFRSNFLYGLFSNMDSLFSLFL